MVGLPDGEKNFEDIYNRLDTIPACDGRTDGRTDILQRHSSRYAYASRGKNCGKTAIKCTQAYHFGDKNDFYRQGPIPLHRIPLPLTPTAPRPSLLKS